MTRELTKNERLAALVALEKRLKEQLDEAKAEVRAQLMASAEEGYDRQSILVNDQKVGEVGVSYTTPQAYMLTGFESEGIACLHALGLTEEKPVKGWEKHFVLKGGEVVCTDTGEVAAWAGWQGSAPKSAAVRGCKPDDVAQAFGCGLTEISQYLLEGGM